MIIEVKGWNAEHIVAVKSPNEIYLKDYPNAVSSPKKQANAYRFALLNMLNSHYGINPVIVSCVAYPFISETEYANKGLNIVSEPEVTLFAEDLVSEQKLSAKLGVVFKQNKVQHADKTSGIVYDTIRKHFENAVTVKTEELENNYSELRIYGKGLTFSDVEVVVKNYTSGIKQIIFVKTPEELERLAENTDKRLLEEYETLFSNLGQQNLIPYGKRDELVGIKQSDETFEHFLEKVEYENKSGNNDELYDKLFKQVLDRKAQLEEISKIRNLSEAEKTIAILVRKNYEIAEILRRGKEKNILVESDKNTNLYKLQSTIDLCKLTSALCNPYNTIYLYDLIYSIVHYEHGGYSYCKNCGWRRGYDNTVFSPDFSMFTDMPKALQIYSVFKNRWCGAYWQNLGLRVIPTISWGIKAVLNFVLTGWNKEQQSSFAHIIERIVRRNLCSGIIAC